MSDKLQVERDPQKRCKSDRVQAPGRTHFCRLTKHTVEVEHRCICGLKWQEAVA